MFVYRAASASAYKWEFVGGPPMLSDVQSDEAFAGSANVYGACPTDGPVIVVPRAGDYRVYFNAESYSGATGIQSYVAARRGVATISDSDSGYQYLASPNLSVGTHVRDMVFSSLGAGEIHIFYKTAAAAGNTHFRKRELRVTPIRVS